MGWFDFLKRGKNSRPTNFEQVINLPREKEEFDRARKQMIDEVNNKLFIKTGNIKRKIRDLLVRINTIKEGEEKRVLTAQAETARLRNNEQGPVEEDILNHNEVIISEAEILIRDSEHHIQSLSRWVSLSECYFEDEEMREKEKLKVTQLRELTQNISGSNVSEQDNPAINTLCNEILTELDWIEGLLKKI